MKRVRVQRMAGQLYGAAAARPPAAAPLLAACSSLSSASASAAAAAAASAPSACTCAASSLYNGRGPRVSRRCQSTAAYPTAIPTARQFATPLSPTNTAPARGPSTDPRFPELFPEAAASPPYPSPLPERAHKSAKLAALHARLGLSQRLPLETLARTLVDGSADASPRFNNASLAYLGMTLINYHTSEWLMCRYPRLPMVILYAAMRAYAGPQALADVARQWGVEAAAAPGAEVDPGLLQFSVTSGRPVLRRWGYERAEAQNLVKYKWRHGISSRVVLDDDFGDMVDAEAEADAEAEETETAAVGSMDAVAKTGVADEAHANFVRAVAGAVYAHGGREAVRGFVRAHVLSRQLDLEQLFRFQLPTRELAYLCARENFEEPVARLEMETGRGSRTPVYVVGIYSGNDKLGEGAASSLDHARAKAAMNSLKAWYLYSPGEDVRVPSDMLVPGAAPWEPAHVDIGEIL